MPKNKKLDEAVEPETVAPEEVEETGGSVAVYQSSSLIRTYSLADHGKKYKALAAEFAGKVAGREVRPK